MPKRKGEIVKPIDGVEAPEAWWTLKVALAALAMHYALGSFAVIMFFAGWLWAVRDVSKSQVNDEENLF